MAKFFISICHYGIGFPEMTEKAAPISCSISAKTERDWSEIVFFRVSREIGKRVVAHRQKWVGIVNIDVYQWVRGEQKWKK